jgi:hypothetical protein
MAYVALFLQIMEGAHIRRLDLLMIVPAEFSFELRLFLEEIAGGRALLGNDFVFADFKRRDRTCILVCETDGGIRRWWFNIERQTYELRTLLERVLEVVPAFCEVLESIS